jgi:hypothetical protein
MPFAGFLDRVSKTLKSRERQHFQTCCAGLACRDRIYAADRTAPSAETDPAGIGGLSVLANSAIIPKAIVGPGW